MTLLKNHYHPKPSEIVQRYKFDSRSRKPDESVLEYVAELRRLAQDCNYGDKLQQMLRDRLVCGISDERIQRRLLSEAELTFDKALSIAVETANKNAQDLKIPSASVKFMKAKKGSQGASGFKGAGKECYRCKGTRHTAADCKFKQEKCHACGKIGHIARACRNKDVQNQGSRDNKDVKKETKQGAYHRSHQVEVKQEESDSSSEEALPMYFMKYKLGQMSDVQVRRVDPYVVTLKLNNKNVQFEIDTGCSLTVMNENTFKKLWKETNSPDVKPVRIHLETYTGDPVKVMGVATVKVKYKQQSCKLPLVVVGGNGPSLFGRGWMEKNQLDWKEIKADRKASKVMHIKTEKMTLQQVLDKHENVFKEELGTLKGTKAQNPCQG